MRSVKEKRDKQEFLSINVGFEVEESRHQIHILSSKSMIHSFSHTRLWSKLSTFVLTTDCREKLLGFTWKCVTNLSCLHCRGLPASRNFGRVAQQRPEGRISGDSQTKKYLQVDWRWPLFAHIQWWWYIFSVQLAESVGARPPPFTLSTPSISWKTETTFNYCWRVKSSFKLVWIESTSSCNSLIGHSLKWCCCSLVWPISLLTL
jgi:hypothetical protein